jgi:two-component system, probable response regulator PhcQ
LPALYDYRRFAILYVDDEEKSLSALARALGGTFRFLTAPNAEEGLRLLHEHSGEIGLLMTDQRMPGEKGVQLLERARQINPRITRILVTAYTDFDAAIEAVNSGAIYKYISKPWDVRALEMMLRRGLEFFIVQRERDLLLREKLSALHRLIITDRVISLGIVAAGLGHHIRNALTAVSTFLDLAPAKLREEQVDLEQMRDASFWGQFYENVRGQVQRIAHLLGELEGASDDGRDIFIDSVRLRPLVDDVLAHHREELTARGLVIDNQIPHSLPALSVDRPRFGRIFELLLKDELINLPDGSRIWLRAEHLASEGANGGVIHVEVEDDGPGLPEQALKSVFDPFFVRCGDPQEFGINLMACYFLVHHHGGTIEAQSPQQRGARFALRFPIKPAEVPSAQAEREFLSRVLLNERLWERLLAEG